jgi:tellurite methyltransferase
MGGAEAKWDKIYASRDKKNQGSVNEGLLAVSELLPFNGRALDLAGGSGQNAVWLVKRGMDVTLLDVSSEGLKQASQRAKGLGLNLNLSKVNLEEDNPPVGPWDLIIVVNYCQTELYRTIKELLSPGGVVAVVQATVKNLERHSSPSARFLLDDKEIGEIFDNLNVLHNESGWMKNGRHEVTIVAQRPV